MNAVAPADAIIEGLRCGRSNCACKRGGIVHCPSHQDSSPSFSVTDKAGSVLVHCFTGCSQEVVIEALRERGLWSTSTRPLIRPKAQPKRTDTGMRRCPTCGGTMLPPDKEIGAVWFWCEDCEQHVAPGAGITVWYEHPADPRHAGPRPRKTVW